MYFSWSCFLPIKHSCWVLCLVLLPCVDAGACFAQSAEVDSLLRIIHRGEQKAPDTAFVRALNQLAYRYDGYKTDSARILAEKARTLAENLDDKRGLARSYINIGNINETKGQYMTAQQAHLRGIELAQSIGDKSLAARAYNGLGIVYWDKGEYQSALKSYLQSLQLYEELKDTTNTARAVNNIAIIHQQTNNVAEAMRYYRLSYAIAQSGRDKKSILVALGNIGQLFYQQKRMDSGLAYLQASYTIAVEINDKHSIAARLNDIGELFQHQGKYNEALQYLFRALRIKEEIGESTYMVNSFQTIAQTLAAAGRAQEGLVYAKRAVDSAEAMGAKAYLRDALGILVTVYDSLGRHKDALSTYRKLTMLRDSLISDEALKRTFALQAEYESEKKDKQILVLTKDRELQETMRRMLVALGAALVLGLAGLYSRYRLKASSERALQAQNAEILRQQQLLEEQAVDIETANTALQEKNLALEQQQEILEEQAREIEIANTVLLEKNVELEGLNNEKNEFLGIAAHDLKNPLAHIIMVTGTATRYYDRMTDNDIKGHFQSIGDVARRMTKIIANLLDVNAIERGGLSLNPTSFDIVPKVLALVQDYTNRATEKNITLHTELPDSSVVYADEQAMMQVMENLLSNAVKYSPHGKNVFVRITTGGKEIRKQNVGAVSAVIPQPLSPISCPSLRLEVQDEGQGISPDDMQKLFGKFARLSARPTGGEHSTGLGLSIVKKMVEAMNGKVWCESEFGKGATFIVELSRIAD